MSENLEFLLQSDFVSEEIQQMYFSDKIYRIPATEGKRYYQLANGCECVGVTQFIENNSKYLVDWREAMIEKLGKENTKKYVGSTADYGTMLHVLFGMFLKNGKITIFEIEEYITDFHNGKMDSDILRLQIRKMKKDMSCLVQYAYENIQTLLAIEIAVWDCNLRLATQIDIIVRDKSSKVISLNVKSGEKSYDTHAKQCAIESLLLKSTIPNLALDDYGTLHPKDYKKQKPTYSFESHKEFGEAYLSEQFAIEHRLAELNGVFDIKKLKTPEYGDFIFGQPVKFL